MYITVYMILKSPVKKRLVKNCCEVLYIAEMTVELKGILAERRHDDYTTVKV